MKTAKKATVMTSTTANAMATITQNQNAVIRGHSTSIARAVADQSGGFGVQMAARPPLDGDRHDAGALDHFEDFSQPDFLAPGRKVDTDHRHRGVAGGADRGAHRLGGIPAALGTRAAAAADEIERHPPRCIRRRGLPTSLHISTTWNLAPPLRCGDRVQALRARRQRAGTLPS